MLLVLGLPIWVIEASHATFLSGLVLEFLSCVSAMKLLSYAHVMHAVR